TPTPINTTTTTTPPAVQLSESLSLAPTQITVLLENRLPLSVLERQQWTQDQWRAIIADHFYDSNSSDTVHAESLDDGSFTVTPGGRLDLQDLRILPATPEAPAQEPWSGHTRYADVTQAQQLEVAQMLQSRQQEVLRQIQHKLKTTAKALRVGAHYALSAVADTSAGLYPPPAIPLLTTLNLSSFRIVSSLNQVESDFTDAGEEGDDEADDEGTEDKSEFGL
ncbi:hypothetical protein DXG01_014050, partial [Tephrocybe rancida]